MRCPNCQSTTRQQRTYVITEYLRDIVHCCKNKSCGHVFVTQEEFIRSVLPPLDQADSPVSAGLWLSYQTKLRANYVNPNHE